MHYLKQFYTIITAFLLILTGGEAYGQKLQLSEIDSLRILLKRTNDDEKKVLLLNEIARRYLHIRNYEAATSITTKAKEMAEATGYNFGILKSYENFVNMYRERGNLTKAVENLKKMLDLAKKIKVPLSEAEAYDQLGHIYYSEGNEKDALLHHKMALNLRQEERDAHGIANSADNIAQILYRQDDYLKALDYWDQAYHAYKKTDNYWGMARTSANLGLIHFEFSNFSKAISLFYEARELYSSIENNDGITWANNLIGNVYLEINKIDDARTIFSQSLETYLKQGDQRRIAEVYANLASTARKEKKYERAKHYCHEAIKAYAMADTSGLIFLSPYRQLAEMDYELGEKQEALAKFLSVLDRPMVSQNIANKVVICNWIGRIYRDLGQYDLAKKWLNESIRLNKRIADKSAYLLSYQTLATVDSAMRDFRSAYINTQKYYLYRDSLEQQKTDRIVLKYGYEKQLSNALEMSRHQRQQRNIAWSLAGIIFLFALISWRYLLSRSKHRIALEKVKKNAAILNQEMKTRFLANISHEFRTPLTLINGHLELLKMNDSSAADRLRYEEISKNGEHLLDLIDQLLELSKMEDGHYKLHYEKGKVLELIRMQVASFESEAIRRRLRFIVNIPSIENESFLNQEFIYSRQAVVSIVYNLLSNALKYTPCDGEIMVDVQFVNQMLHISISNTGHGIAEEELPKIFDRFYHLPGQTPYKGFGIGLSLVKELVVYHGGNISVESQLGGTTKFHVQLAPGHISSECLDDIAATPSLMSTSDCIHHEISHFVQESTSIDGRPVLLLVDDHEEIRRFVKESLGSFYHFIEAPNGEEGLKIAKSTIPDLIISDVMMPRMDGTSFCKAIKESEATSHIPVILLTAVKDQTKKEESLYTGAYDYIYKPFSVRELQLKVRNTLESRERLRAYLSSSLVGVGEAKDIQIDQSQSVSKLDNDFIQKLVDSIHANLDNKEVNVNFLAQIACLSPSQLTRKLKALIDRTPAEFIRLIKMNYAKQLLEAGSRVADAAWTVGYDDPTYFSKVYKKQFGYSPSDQRVERHSIGSF